MGLPNKKQLHKHKRGTRKALDTIDAMEKDDDQSIADPGVESLIESKKTKNSPAKTEEQTSTDESEPSAAPSTHSNSINLETDSDKAEHVSKSAENDSQEGNDRNEHQKIEEAEGTRKNIDLDGLEETSFPEDNAAASEQIVEASASTPTPETASLEGDTPPSGESAGKPDDTTELNTSLTEIYDEEFEDTQKDKYLTFRIGDESFGFAIEYITEIIVIHKITEVPDTPAFVRGVINLRGKVIPVMDIRHRFNMELREYDDRTCIIVVEYEETAVGLIVDTVNEVADIPEDQIDPPPKTHAGIESSYIMGMGKIGKQVIILLNLEKVLFVDEILAKKMKLEEG